MQSSAMSSAPLAEGLPILESEEQYKAFVKTLHTPDNDDNLEDRLESHPEFFPDFVSKNKNYLKKLNYQFLELDSRERFLRFLNMGSFLKRDEIVKISKEKEAIKAQIAQEKEAVEKLKDGLNTKSDKVIKILVRECKKRNDTTRRMEREVSELESERDQLMAEMADSDLDGYVNKEVLEGKHLNQLEQMKTSYNAEISQSRQELAKLQSQLRGLDESMDKVMQRQHELDEERKNMDIKLARYGEADKPMYTEDEKTRKAQYEALKQLIGTWENI